MNDDPLSGLPRYIDQDGHAVPVTGRWCAACSYPLHPSNDRKLHPLCRLPTDLPETHSQKALTMSEHLPTDHHDWTPDPSHAELFGAWAAERFVPADETPEALSLAAYLNSSRTR